MARQTYKSQQVKTLNLASGVLDLSYAQSTHLEPYQYSLTTTNTPLAQPAHLIIDDRFASSDFSNDGCTPCQYECRDCQNIFNFEDNVPYKDSHIKQFLVHFVCMT